MQFLLNQLQRFSSREQILLAIGVPVTMLLLMYLLFSIPLQDKQQQLQEQLRQETNFTSWFRQNQQQWQGNRGQTFNWQNQSLASLIESTVRQRGLAGWQSRIYQNRDEQMVISFNDIPYSQLSQWLTYLQNQYQVEISSAKLNPSRDKGIINAEVTLAKPTDE